MVGKTTDQGRKEGRIYSSGTGRVLDPARLPCPWARLATPKKGRAAALRGETARSSLMNS